MGPNSTIDSQPSTNSQQFEYILSLYSLQYYETVWSALFELCVDLKVNDSNKEKDKDEYESTSSGFEPLTF